MATLPFLTVPACLPACWPAGLVRSWRRSRARFSSSLRPRRRAAPQACRQRPRPCPRRPRAGRPPLWPAPFPAAPQVLPPRSLSWPRSRPGSGRLSRPRPPCQPACPPARGRRPAAAARNPRAPRAPLQPPSFAPRGFAKRCPSFLASLLLTFSIRLARSKGSFLFIQRGTASLLCCFTSKKILSCIIHSALPRCVLVWRCMVFRWRRGQGGRRGRGGAGRRGSAGDARAGPGQGELLLGQLRRR